MLHAVKAGLQHVHVFLDQARTNADKAVLSSDDRTSLHRKPDSEAVCLFDNAPLEPTKRCALTSRVRNKAAVAAMAAAFILIAHVAPAASDLAKEGNDIAERLCASCHAIGRSERSPMQVAPAFRRMETRMNIDDMAERLQDGIIAGHPEMPAFVLKEQEARALVAYIRSLGDDDANR